MYAGIHSYLWGSYSQYLLICQFSGVGVCLFFGFFFSKDIFPVWVKIFTSFAVAPGWYSVLLGDIFYSLTEDPQPF